jgi:hypothetical protein
MRSRGFEFQVSRFEFLTQNLKPKRLTQMRASPLDFFEQPAKRLFSSPLF